MKQIDKIVKGIVEPTDINVLWLDTNDKDKPVLKAYNNGTWSAISNGGDSPEPTPTPTEGAVSYEPQELTEEQQMQARKNQGLYWKEEHTSFGEKETTQPESWSDAYAFYSEGFTKQDFIEGCVHEGFFEGLFKVSDDAPTVSDLISLTLFNTEGQYICPVVDSRAIIVDGEIEIDIYQEEDLYAWYMNSHYEGEFPFDYASFIVVTSDSGADINVYGDTSHLDKGIYCSYNGGVPNSADESTWEVSWGSFLTYNGETTVVDISKVPSEYVEAVAYTEQSLKSDEQMQARINQGLYAKIKTTETIYTWDGDTTGKDVFENAYYKISDDVNNDTAELIRYIAGEINTEI